MLAPILHEHFKAPRNVGRIDAPTGRGRAENPSCGDVVEIEVRVVGDAIEAIGFLAQGCAATIACASFVTERVRNVGLAAATSLEADSLLAEVGENNAARRHGMTLAIRALHAALR